MKEFLLSRTVSSICLTCDCIFVTHSPSQGPCCTPECSFKGTNDKCRLESECAQLGLCNGATALCPASEPKANFTSCHSDTQVCLNSCGTVPNEDTISIETSCEVGGRCFVSAAKSHSVSLHHREDGTLQDHRTS